MSRTGRGRSREALRRADRTVAPRFLAVEPVGGSGEVAVIWSPDQRPTVGAAAALPVDEPEAAAGAPAQGDLDAATSPRK